MADLSQIIGDIKATVDRASKTAEKLGVPGSAIIRLFYKELSAITNQAVTETSKKEKEEVTAYTPRR